MGPRESSEAKILSIRTFYRFTSLLESELLSLQKRYEEAGLKNELKGTVLLSEEGCNGTIAGLQTDLDVFWSVLQERFPGLHGQDSYSEFQPFKRWKVPLKKQIVQGRDLELRE